MTSCFGCKVLKTRDIPSCPNLQIFTNMCGPDQKWLQTFNKGSEERLCAVLWGMRCTPSTDWVLTKAGTYPTLLISLHVWDWRFMSTTTLGASKYPHISSCSHLPSHESLTLLGEESSFELSPYRPAECFLSRILSSLERAKGIFASQDATPTGKIKLPSLLFPPGLL